MVNYTNIILCISCVYYGDSHAHIGPERNTPKFN